MYRFSKSPEGEVEGEGLVGFGSRVRGEREMGGCGAVRTVTVEEILSRYQKLKKK